MSFTIENEKENTMFVLDLEIICEEKKTSITFVCHQPNFSGVFTHLGSFLPSAF